MEGKWRNARRRRSQTIPHGVSPLKSRLDAGHRAEPFPQGTVRPWKRWWCGGRPITGPYLLKGLPFPLVSCPHAKGRREVFPPRVTAVRAVLITCGIIQPSCSSEDPRLPTFHRQDLPTPGVGRVCGRVALTPDDNYCPHAEAAPGTHFPQVINTRRKCDWAGVTGVRPISTCWPSPRPRISLRSPSSGRL